MIDLNFIIGISLGILAFFSFCLFVIVVPVVLQLSRTLSSVQHLIDIINDDLEPTVKDIKENLFEVKNKIQKNSVILKTFFKKTQIIVVSGVYGLLYGIKDYLYSTTNQETSYNGKDKEKSGAVK